MASYSMVSTHTLILFFFNDTATTEIYTLSLHDALPISQGKGRGHRSHRRLLRRGPVPGNPAHGHGHRCRPRHPGDRKSTRLNSSHGYISYAVFCLKKKKNKKEQSVYGIRLETK